MDYPAPITAYLLNRTADSHHLAYFVLDPSGHILGWGGAIEHYRIQPPRKGMRVADLFTFAEGMLPPGAEALVLECVEISDGQKVDVHLFESQDQIWLMLLDAREKAENRRLLQQKAHELVLLRDMHARILDQHLGKDMTERLLQIDFKKGGERRILSILFADIRGFSTYCEQRPSADVFQMLNAYLTAMIRPVLDGGGIIDKIIGDAVMAIFGLLPSGLPAPELAVAAAGEILKQTDTVAAERRKQKQAALGVGVGISTGPVVLGLLGSKDRRALSVTGHSVNLAARLESQAAQGEVIIDAGTFGGLEKGVSRTAFAPKTLDLKGMQRLINAYGWVRPHE